MSLKTSLIKMCEYYNIGNIDDVVLKYCNIDIDTA